MHTVLDESSWISFIADLVSDVKGTKNNAMMKKSEIQKSNYIGGSIAKYSKDLTMTFPTLIDNSLSPETASMISKANERNIISMLQMLFASMQLRAVDGKEVIERIYGNKYGLTGMKYDDYADALINTGRFAMESVNISEDVMADAVKKMEAELKRPQKNFPTDSFSDNSLNDYSVFNINGTEKVRFNPVKEDINDPNFDDDEIFGRNRGNGWQADKYGFVHRDVYNVGAQPTTPDANTADVQNRALNYAYQRQNQLAQQDLANRKFAQQQRMDRATLRNLNQQYRNNQDDVIQKQLLDSDIKKANEMQPSLIIVHYTEVDPSNDYKAMDERNFVAGVKSRLIPVSSSDIVDRVVVKNNTKVNFLNFIRATTGEIGFFKDFLFCLKQAKIDAKNSIKRGEAAQMWKTLESLSVKNKANKIRKTGNDASAITTLVINQETVNLIKKQHEIDLENVNTARMILGDYNLLGMIIADESIEVVKFLYDGQDMFEQQAYSFLEKENADKSYKKIINLMSQNRRF